jgi:uncharacterized protein
VSRVLWWLVIGLAAYWLVQRLRAERPAGSGQADRSAGPAPPAVPAAVPLTMVRCAHCGLHLPQADAMLDEARRSYCSPAHRGAGPA